MWSPSIEPFMVSLQSAGLAAAASSAVGLDKHGDGCIFTGAGLGL